MLGSFTRKEKREADIRVSLLERLKHSVQALIQGPGSEGTPRLSGNAPKGPALGHTNNTNAFCCVLEALFIHGLKGSFGDKFASFFLGDPDRMPVPNFWPVILVISHRDLLEQVSGLSFITSDVGKGRAWLRLALNQNQLSSYISVLASDEHILQEYYRSAAFFRDTESCDIMLRVLQPVGGLSFNLATNAAILNTWTQTPLMLSGMWIQAKDNPFVDPVLSGTDVASTFESEVPREQGGISIPHTPLSDQMFDLIIGRTPETSFLHCIENEEQNKEVLPTSEETLPHKPEIESFIKVVPSNEESPLVATQNKIHLEHQDTNIDEDEPTKKKTTDGEKRHATMSTSGRSTLLNRSISTIPDGNEYKSLISDWVVSDNADHLPAFLNICPFQFSSRRQPIDTEEIMEVEALGFEIVSSKFPTDASELLPLLTILSTEEGLDSQSYLCHGTECTSHIGMIYGKPRLCKYDGKYYCYECHLGETSIIAARIIHNWDFHQYPVCAHNKKWLNLIHNIPVINIRLVNPKLYRHIDDLAEAQMLRLQLYYVQAYLFTCRIDEGKELRKLFWPREHLYEHVHLVSIADLEQVYQGKLVPLLRQGVTYGRHHIIRCKVCSPRGFICEVCKDPKIIYPFQLGDTFTCPSCCGVYHVVCIKRKEDCPRCHRIQERSQSPLQASSQEAE